MHPSGPSSKLRPEFSAGDAFASHGQREKLIGHSRPSGRHLFSRVTRKFSHKPAFWKERLNTPAARNDGLACSASPKNSVARPPASLPRLWDCAKTKLLRTIAASHGSPPANSPRRRGRR